MSSVFFHNVLI